MRVVLLALGLGVLVFAADAPLQPVRVCEVMQDLAAYAGKTVLVAGRFSFRESGRSLSEECDHKLATLRLVYDPKTAPKSPERLEIDTTALSSKLKVIKASTSLGKFRFGSSDYDRWAVVYGRLQTIPAKNAGAAQPELLYHGDALIVFLGDQ
jgi:hypothetical protein